MDLPLKLSGLPITSLPFTEDELLAKKKWRAKMKKGKHQRKRRPTKYTMGLPQIQQQHQKDQPNLHWAHQKYARIL
jgi:hypothetical protein